MRKKGSKNKKTIKKIVDKEIEVVSDNTQTTKILKTVSHRNLERELVRWMNDFCLDKGAAIANVNVMSDGRAFMAFISYWSEE